MKQTILIAALLVAVPGVSHADLEMREHACQVMSERAGMVALRRDKGMTQDEIFRAGQADIREQVEPGSLQEAILLKHVHFINQVFGHFRHDRPTDVMQKFYRRCLDRFWDYRVVVTHTKY